jgi:hypothetical protein
VRYRDQNPGETGLWDDLRINTAVVLPLSVEAYAGYALLAGRHRAVATDSPARPPLGDHQPCRRRS